MNEFRIYKNNIMHILHFGKNNLKNDKILRFTYNINFWLGFFIPLTIAIHAVISIPLLRSMPILLFILIVLIFTKHRKINNLFIWIYPYYLLSAYLIIGILQTDAPKYGIYKATLYLMYFILFGLSLLFSLKTIDAVNDLYYGLAFGCLIYVLISLIFLGNPLSMIYTWKKYERLNLGHGNPIIMSQYYGLGIILLTWFVVKTKKYIYLLAYTPIIMISLGYMFLSGSKGPLLSLTLCILITLLISNRKILFISAILIIFLYCFKDYYINYLPAEFLKYRFGIIGSPSVSVRLDHYRLALNNYFDFEDLKVMFGAGTGNYADIFWNKDLRIYPHNVFIEILYEGGVFGFMLYFICICVPFVAAMQAIFKQKYINIDHEGKLTTLFTLMLYIYSVINAQLTGDIGSNWFISLFGYVLLAINFSYPVFHEQENM